MEIANGLYKKLVYDLNVRNIIFRFGTVSIFACLSQTIWEAPEIFGRSYISDVLYLNALIILRFDILYSSMANSHNQRSAFH